MLEPVARSHVDILSEALSLVRVQTTVVFRILFGSPWGLGLDAQTGPAFHMITAGSCWLEIEGEDEQVLLKAGDLAILPTGRRHWVRDETDTPARGSGAAVAVR
jgi:quercetin dioxygenase-like cupin family protein